MMHAGPDVPFVNNYGVWKDEFRELGLEGTLDHEWKDAMCYFGEGQEVRVGRGYGRYTTCWCSMMASRLCFHTMFVLVQEA